MKAKSIDLTTAVAALPRVNVANWTFAELVETYTARHCTRGDTERLRKWTALLGAVPAWDVTTEQLVAGRDAMTAQGYSVGAVNRDLSAIGSAYRFAEDKRITPRGFVSPTRVIRRQAEPIRRVMLSDAERAAIVAGARTATRGLRCWWRCWPTPARARARSWAGAGASSTPSAGK